MLETTRIVEREPGRLSRVTCEELKLVLEGPVLTGVVQLTAEELRPFVGRTGDREPGNFLGERLDDEIGTVAEDFGGRREVVEAGGEGGDGGEELPFQRRNATAVGKKGGQAGDALGLADEDRARLGGEVTDETEGNRARFRGEA